MSEAPDPRPQLRSAEVMTEASLRAALAGGDIETIHLALIDGCRFLDPKAVYPLARSMLAHPNDRVRWAAFFALDFLRAEVVNHIDDDDDDLVFEIGAIASKDPSQEVRAMAVQTLVGLVFQLARR